MAHAHAAWPALATNSPSTCDPATVLVVDDDPVVPAILSKALAAGGRRITVCDDGDEALRLVREQPFDLVISDVRLGTQADGLDVLRAAKEVNPSGQVILISAHGSLEATVEGLRAGAFDVIGKPFDVRDVIDAAERALAARAQALTQSHSRATTTTLPAGLIGRSRAMLDLYKQVALAAGADTPVMIVGESGTGKELVARAIHEYGGTTQRPFVAVNCGALAESLLESELFGHVKGAFTGAVTDRRGLFQQATGGTLFLDEIGETSPGLQVKLLRVLQEGEVRPVGGSRTVSVGARVVAATNRVLEDEVAAGRFRKDLYYRLGALVLRVPPLRDRRDDVPLLVARFLRNASARARREARLEDGAMEALCAHAWPGNVRELENSVERLVIAARGGRVTAEDVRALLRAPSPATVGTTPAFAGLPTLDELERRYLVHVLEAAGGNRTRAARMLGIDRRTLYRMAARFGIPLAGGEAEEEASAS
jgi:DNA-binding NtrC family response regulator